MFVHTAETVLTLTRSQMIANAITRAGGGGRPIRERVWMLRSAFDALLDEIGEGEDDATLVDDVSAEVSRFGQRLPTRDHAANQCGLDVR